MKNLLHVEDDESTRILVKEIVGELYNYTSTDNVDDAMKILKKKKIDIILLDLRLNKESDVSGEFSSIQLLKHLHEKKFGKKVVILSALSENSKQIKKVYTTVVNEILHKPFRRLDLLNAIAKTVKK